MPGDTEGDIAVYFYYDTGGDNKASLRMNLGTDDPDDIPVVVSASEFSLLEGLEAFAPDNFRRLMDHLIETAERIGFDRGRQSVQSHKVASGLDSHE